MALGGVGNIFFDLDEFEKALPYYEKALSVSRETKDKNAEALWAWNLGLVYEKMGNDHKAVDFFSITVEIEAEMGHKNADEDRNYLDRVRKRL